MRREVRRIWVDMEDRETGLKWGTYKTVVVRRRRRINWLALPGYLLNAACFVYMLMWCYWFTTVVLPTIL